MNYRAIPRQNIDSSIIKMSWVTRFPRARQALALLETRHTHTLAGARELRRVLTRTALLGGHKRLPIGSLGDAVALHETAHLNSIGVAFGGSVDSMPIKFTI